MATNHWNVITENNILAPHLPYSLPPPSDIGTDISLYRDNQQCVPNLNTAYLDGSLTLECIAPDGYPMVNVTWYRSGVKLRQVEEPTIDFANSRREMTISSLVPGDTGTYHCEAANNVNRNNPLQSEELYIMVEGKEDT